jgi:hypothetical protein
MRKERRRMNLFVAKFSHIIKGVMTGFDRIVFKGSILPLCYANGAMRFFASRGVRNKDFKRWAIEQTTHVVEGAECFAASQGVDRIERIVSSAHRKEDIAHKRQTERGIDAGLVGVWSATESCWSYKACYSAEQGYPQLRWEPTKCKHLYFYLDHADYGFMNIRLQTWFPYHIQICLNGREWLRRSLERTGRDFVVRGNKFLHIDDYGFAQRQLDLQLDTRWEHMLNGFLADVFPAKEAILGPHLSYYWTLWQSEWATDLVYPSPEDIAPVADSLLRHAFMTGTGDRVLRYLGRPLKLDGTPRSDMGHDVVSRLLKFHEGLRVRHWVDGNSVKCYNELNVLRVEMTMNQPDMFKVHRHAQGETESQPKRLLPLRKGVADTVLRTQVSQEVTDRFFDNLAAAQCETPVAEILDGVVKSFTKNGRRVRALDPTGKDRALLQALRDPQFLISGTSNKALRESLRGKPGYKNMTEKQLSAKLSRQLRLLRDHSLIRKIPRQRRYMITQKGRETTMALDALLAASTKQLMDFAA